jgi:hypothetical protein
MQGQIDGNIVSAQFTMVRKPTPPPLRREASPPPKREIMGRDMPPRDGLKDVPRRRDCKWYFLGFTVGHGSCYNLDVKSVQRYFGLTLQI